MTYIRQLLMIMFATIVFLALQYQYWFGSNGHRDLRELNKQVSEQEYINSEQQKANQVLFADIKDLKNGVEAVEEHARVDLGLIKSGETFVQMSTADNVYSANTNKASPQAIQQAAIEGTQADSAAIGNDETDKTADGANNEEIYH